MSFFEFLFCVWSDYCNFVTENKNKQYVPKIIIDFIITSKSFCTKK